MRLTSFLHGHFARLYQARPDLTTDEAAEFVLRLVAGHPDRDQFQRELMRRGAASEWGGFYGRLRQRAQRLAKRAATKRTPMGEVVEFAMQMKLPLPDPDCSPTRGECTALMLRESNRYLRQHRQSLSSQIAFNEAIATQLEAVSAATGEADLTVRAAHEAGLMDWRVLAAA